MPTGQHFALTRTSSVCLLLSRPPLSWPGAAGTLLRHPQVPLVAISSLVEKPSTLPGSLGPLGSRVGQAFLELIVCFAMTMPFPGTFPGDRVPVGRPGIATGWEDISGRKGGPRTLKGPASVPPAATAILLSVLCPGPCKTSD